MIHPSNLFEKNSISICMPVTVLDVRNIAANKSDNLLLTELLHAIGEIDKIQVNEWLNEVLCMKWTEWWKRY